jgi:CubicO group peptidase (beta-lactamase class C family)
MRFLLAVLTIVLLSPALFSKDQPVAGIAAEAQRRADSEEFAGVVLVARDGKPVFEHAYGYANREDKTSNSLDTRFRFGSMGKMFTAVAALQLVQAGKLSLDAPVGKYLPDYPNKQVAAVTIEQLLTHTGGTGNIFSPEYFDRRLETREHQDYLDLFGSRGVAFEPGSRWDYSNYGMVLLGRVIEVVSGQSYYDYTRTYIFEPLGMADTGNDPEDSHVRNLSTGYTRMGPRPGPPGPLRPNTDTLPYRGTAAGGGYSTARDLLKFVNGLNAHRLLDATHTAWLLKPRLPAARPGAEQALGFSVRTFEGGRKSVGHGGGAPGMNGELYYFPDTRFTVIVLSNLDPPAATELADYVVATLP